MPGLLLMMMSKAGAPGVLPVLCTAMAAATAHMLTAREGVPRQRSPELWLTGPNKARTCHSLGPRLTASERPLAVGGQTTHRR